MERGCLALRRVLLSGRLPVVVPGGAQAGAAGQGRTGLGERGGRLGEDSVALARGGDERALLGVDGQLAEELHMTVVELALIAPAVEVGVGEGRLKRRDLAHGVLDEVFGVGVRAPHGDGEPGRRFAFGLNAIGQRVHLGRHGGRAVEGEPMARPDLREQLTTTVLGECGHARTGERDEGRKAQPDTQNHVRLHCGC